mgnify:CR=1 FL=1
MTDDLDDRLSERFESDDTDANTKSQNAQKSQKEDTPDSGNVKRDWNVRSVYLDDELDDQLTTAFKRLDLELSEAGSDLQLKKTRHFYPLVVALGLEQLERMEVSDITERLD